MKKSVFTLIFILGTCLAFGRGDINYEHKAIQKTLVKNCKLTNVQLKEVKLHEELNAGVQGKFFTINSDNTDSDITHMYIGRVNSCRAGGCSLPGATPMGDSEYFDYMMLFNKKAEVVLVKIFNYQATHGHEVTAKGWLKQFIGYDTHEAKLEVGRNIDSISGATISVNGITEDVSHKTKLFESYLSKS
ncbi:FMN-binding protein [Carboxylicivirga marina]|uniref:FMN-binding protein n=1 Tax=Carboxylicivirga marina TaxID=2800988 RepID=A0ABS1HJA8_9BACT|nr:FMN-binding protein [Carboxylicivirga marina]MBK3517764.1 FMN-binding protein [Carboxylicivirga marina]